MADYLREEIAAEGLIRNLPAFSEFLTAAAFSDGSSVNFSNIARDCGVSHHTARSYFEILEDSLLGSWLPAYRKRRERRVIGAPKFYFADVGVVNRLARRGEIQRGSEAYGKAFEHWVWHEIRSWIDYQDVDAELLHWHLPSGIEVDFVLGEMLLAIEAKSSERISDRHLKGLRVLKQEHPHVGRRVVACLEPRARKTDNGIEILPATTFTQLLWQGDLL